MKKVFSLHQYELPVEIKPDGDGLLATCPVWQDCYAQGDTVDEVISEITAVAASLVELYQEEDLKIPLKVKRRMQPRREVSLRLPLVVSPAA